MSIPAILEPGWRIFHVLTLADAVMIVVVLLGAVVGFWSGFVWQVIRLASVGVCIWVTCLYYPIVASVVGREFSEPVRMVGSATAVFAATLLVCYLLAYLFREVINALRPKLADRLLGAAFGAFKGLVIVALFGFLVLEHAGQDSAVRARVQESKAVVAVGTCLGYTLPDGIRGRIRSAGLERSNGRVSVEPSSAPPAPALAGRTVFPAGAC